jgi:hypothetical protein
MEIVRKAETRAQYRQQDYKTPPEALFLSKVNFDGLKKG